MDEPADTSSQNRPGWYLLDEGVSTRNRKVVGSNPTSGSKTAGQSTCTVISARLAYHVDHPFVREPGLGGPPRFAT